MSTLQERLDRIRANFAKQAPEAARAIMGQATADLQTSGILERIPKAGDPFFPFEMPDDQGQVIRSADLLAQGPLVLTVYRGVW